MTTRTEYGYRKDCAAQGCDPPCRDAEWVTGWVQGMDPPLHQRPPRPAAVWDKAEQRFKMHATRWVSRTVTVTEWEPIDKPKPPKIDIQVAPPPPQGTWVAQQAFEAGREYERRRR